MMRTQLNVIIHFFFFFLKGLRIVGPQKIAEQHL